MIDGESEPHLCSLPNARAPMDCGYLRPDDDCSGGRPRKRRAAGLCRPLGLRNEQRGRRLDGAGAKRGGMERSALDGGATEDDQKPPVCRWKAYLQTGPENRSARVSRRTLYRRTRDARSGGIRQRGFHEGGDGGYRRSRLCSFRQAFASPTPPDPIFPR